MEKAIRVTTRFLLFVLIAEGTGVRVSIRGQGGKAVATVAGIPHPTSLTWPSSFPGVIALAAPGPLAGVISFALVGIGLYQ